MNLIWNKISEDEYTAEYENYSARIDRWGRRHYQWTVFVDGKKLIHGFQNTPKLAKDRARYHVEKQVNLKAVDKIINALIQ